MSPFSKHRAAGFASILVGLLSLGPRPCAADEIFTVIEGELSRIDTEQSSSVEVGPFDLEISDLTFTPQDRLWALTPSGDIYEVDPLTAQTTFLRSVQSIRADSAAGLAVLDDGTLFIYALDELIRVDPETDEETVLSLHHLQEDDFSTFLETFFVSDDALVGLGKDFSIEDEALFFGIGETSGTIAPIRSWDWPTERQFIDSDVDSEGNLWILWTEPSVIGLPGEFPSRLAAFDPRDGSALSKPSYNFARPDIFYAVRRSTPDPPSCTPSDSSFCFLDGRFRVTVAWRDTQGAEGVGRKVPGSSDQSGLMWFFTPNNWEVMVKVLDGCPTNEHVWVFLSATTDVEFTLTVTDTVSGAERTYSNASGNNAATVIDLQALGC